MKTLTEKIAVMQAALDGKQIQCSIPGRPGAWNDCPIDELSWNWWEFDYRIKPTPKRVPLTREDWDGPVWWVRWDRIDQLVVSISGISIVAATSGELIFKKLFEQDWKRSRDRKTWEPCSKEEA